MSVSGNYSLGSFSGRSSGRGSATRRTAGSNGKSKGWSPTLKCNKCMADISIVAFVGRCNCVLCTNCFNNQDSWKSNNCPVCRAEHEPSNFSKVMVSASTSNSDPRYSMMCALTHPNDGPYVALRDIVRNLMKEQDNFVASTNFFIKQYHRESSRVIHQASFVNSKLELLQKEHQQLKSHQNYFQGNAKERIRVLEGRLAEREKQLAEREKQLAERDKQLKESRAMGRGNLHSSSVGVQHQADPYYNSRQSAPPGSRSSSRQQTNNAYEAMVRRNEAKEMETARILSLDPQPILKCLQPSERGTDEGSRHGYRDARSSSTYPDQRNHSAPNYGNQHDPRQSARSDIGSTFTF